MWARVRARLASEGHGAPLTLQGSGGDLAAQLRILDVLGARLALLRSDHLLEHPVLVRVRARLLVRVRV